MGKSRITRRCSDERRVSREEQKQIIRLLVGHGARPSDKNSAGRSVKDCVKPDWIRELLSQA